MRKDRHLSGVGGALHSAFARLGLEGRLAQQQAVVLWAEVAGPQIAAATRAMYVRDGILFVTAKSSTWAHELILRKAALLDGLNRRLGRGVISDIRFSGRGYREEAAEEKSGPSLPGPDEWQQVELTGAERQSIGEAAGTIEDSDLRALLERVMAHGLRVRRWKEEQGWLPCKSCGLPHAGSAEVCALCRSRQPQR